MSVTDYWQREHLIESPWMTPDMCGCRTRPDGTRRMECRKPGCSADAQVCGGYCPPCFKAHGEQVLADMGPDIDCEHLRRQREWSLRTFGPSRRTAGISDHIRKELDEIADDPDDWREWIDVVILALDGAWRHGGSPREILDAIVEKQTKNEARVWPDWRTMSEDAAIEHDRTVPEPEASRG